MDLKGKKILVTGGMGFIGSRTINKLTEAGADVAVIDNGSSPNQMKPIGPVRLYIEDIGDIEKLRGIFEKEKPEIVYHFAFNILVYKSLEASLGQESIDAGLNLLLNCQKYGVKKIIFASSGTMYGNPKNFPTKETELIDPATHVISKSVMENYIKFFNKMYGLSYVILRYSTVYGPGQKTGAMSDYISSLALGKQSDIWGSGKKTRDYVYVDDVVRANLLALDVPADFKDPVFNVGTAIETSLDDLYTRIAKLLGKEAKPNYLPERPGELLRYSLDYSKIKETLGWDPKYSLEEGLMKKLKEEGRIP